MKKITIEPNQLEKYLCLEDALEEHGYNLYESNQFKLYQKENKIYKVLNWDYENTIIYRIELLEFDEESDVEEYDNQKKRKLLIDELLNKKISINELDRIATKITGYEQMSSLDGFLDYKENNGSICYGDIDIGFDIVNEKKDDNVIVKTCYIEVL